MFNKNTGSVLFYIGFILLFSAFYFTNAEDSYEVSSDEVLNPHKAFVEHSNKILVASNDDSVVSLSPELRKQRLKFILKAGTGVGDLGISSENAKIGPGLIKRIKNGYMISDTFNNRILKLNDEGDILQSLTFSQASLVQGAAERANGDLAVIRKENRKMFLDVFSGEGARRETQTLNIADEEVLHYVGHFRSFYTNDELYIHNGEKTLLINENGSTREVPGIPLEGNSSLYVSSRQGDDQRYIVDIKDNKGQAVKSFYARGQYTSLKNLYTDSKKQIHVEFEELFEGHSLELGKSVTTKSTIVETYDDNGKLLQDNIIENNSDIEIDQNLDVDENGNLNSLVLDGSNFKVYEVLI